MGAALFCHGCGATVAIPPGYTRNKLRCPECGVMIALPVAAAGAAAPTPKRSARPATPAAVKSCPACRQPLPAGVVDCPECAAAAALSLPASRRSRPVETPPPSSTADIATADTTPAPAPELVDDEDDGLPYLVRPGDQQRNCPACNRALEKEDVVCSGCDFDLVRGRQAVRVWPTVQRQWNCGISPEARWTLLVGTLVPFLASTVVGVVSTGDVCTFVVPGLLFSVCITFVLGTWYRVEVTRNAKGRVRLTRTLIVCFFARPARTFRLGDFEGVISGKENKGKLTEWLFLLFFVPTLVGMVLWWYFVIYKEVFQVSLTRDHGYPDEIIYSGWSETTMHEVEKLMREMLRS